MTRTLPFGILLRAAMLSLAPLAFAASTALADVPGSYFPDWQQPTHTRAVAQPAAAIVAGSEDGMPAAHVTVGTMPRTGGCG